MRYLLVGLWVLIGECESVFATDGMEYQIDDERVISCDRAIAGAILQSDEARILSSVVLLMADAPGPGGGFSVSLYENSGSGQPGVLLAVLEGEENPKSAGRYVYDSPEKVVLDFGKNYWVVASVEAPNAAYRYQVIQPDSGGKSDQVCDSFVRLADGAELSGDPPAIFANFGDSSSALMSFRGDHFKLLWTVLLSGVILFCCIDLIPFRHGPASV